MQAPYGAPPEYYGNDVFVLPGLGSDAIPYMTKYTHQEDGTLIETGKMKMPVNCCSSSIAFAGPTKGYINSWLGYIYEFNPQTMTMTTKIDISGHRAEGVSSPLLSGLFVHDGYLYVSVIQCQSTFAPATAPAVEMAQ